MPTSRHIPLDEWLADVWPPDTRDVARLLHAAEFVDTVPIAEGSNYTFLVRIRHPRAGFGLAIYKPQRGESPLWDFPPGTLYRRERASYLLSRFLGWPRIPVTIVRDGPHGVGSAQLFVMPKRGSHFFTLPPAYTDDLEAVAAFDIIVNNADRKGGHVFLDAKGGLWCIDHGLTFNAAPKLRTVIWTFAGVALPNRLLADVRRLRDALQRPAPDAPVKPRGIAGELSGLLSSVEIQALQERIEALLADPVYPTPTDRRSQPWPLI